MFDAVDVGPEQRSLLLGALVVPAEVLGQLLMVVEHDVCLAVSPNHCVQP